MLLALFIALTTPTTPVSLPSAPLSNIQYDITFFNGTNVLLYPEGRGFSFPATVRITTEPDWRVATGMHPAAGGGYTERNYHDLVDMPFFVGAFDYESAMVGGLNARLATYPAGTLSGAAREAFWADYLRMFAPQAAVFGETPYDNYTTMMVFDSAAQGGSAREHQSSHLGLYTPEGIGQRWVSSVTAHEMFHAFNVKRLRPVEMAPYRYDVPQPTPWLWVSEGITDYYADLTLLRGGIADSAEFLSTTGGEDHRCHPEYSRRARGRLALHLDPSDRWHGIPVLSPGLTRRLHAGHPDSRCIRQSALPRRRDAAGLSQQLQEGAWLRRGGVAA